MVTGEGSHKARMVDMLNLKVWAMSLGCWMAATFTICVLGGVIAPSLPIPHRTLELIFPGVRLDLGWGIRPGPGRKLLVRRLCGSPIRADSQRVLAPMDHDPAGAASREGRLTP